MSAADVWRLVVSGNDKLGACPLSRCAIEWLLAVGAVGMAIWFAVLPEGMAMRSYLLHVSSTAAVAIPVSWIATLFLVGAAQLLTLLFGSLRRFAGTVALLSGIAWIYVGVSLTGAGLLLLTWPCALMVGGHLYVTVMFKS